MTRSRAAGLVDSDGEDQVDLAEFSRAMRRHPAVVAALDRMWPVLSPEELLNDLFGAPALLALASRRILSRAERALLSRPRRTSPAEVTWSAADLPLLDEARAVLGPIRARRARGTDPDGGSDGVRTYGHIVVDEAQDLSPMALRMLARRSISGSMTLVGDIGQATSTTAPASWDEVVGMLPTRRQARVTSLTVNYRTPAEIMAVAQHVLAATGVRGLPTLRSVRSTGHLPIVRYVHDGELADTAAEMAAEELASVVGGTVAVIAPEQLLAGIAQAMDAARVPWGRPDRDGLSASVTLLGLASAKGLEFDGVVVVEPAGLVEENPQGLRALFVALTRSTRRLALAHSRALPEPLARGLRSARAGLAESPAGRS